MVTILITNRKGGVGKTTTTTNLAAWFGQMGKRVLMIDLDTQGHLQYGFGFNEAFDNGVHDALTDNTSLLSRIYETPYENIFLIPAHVNYNISDIPNDHSRLKGLIEIDGIDKLYDICLIDTPPTSDILLYNSLFMSDYTIVPIKAEFLGTIGVNQFLKLFYKTASKVNQTIEMMGLLPTMYNRSMKEHALLVDHLKKQFGEDRVFTPIRNDIKLSVSFLEGKPAMYFDRNTRGATDYKQVAQQILKRIN